MRCRHRAPRIDALLVPARAGDSSASGPRWRTSRRGRQDPLRVRARRPRLVRPRRPRHGAARRALDLSARSCSRRGWPRRGPRL